MIVSRFAALCLCFGAATSVIAVDLATKAMSAFGRGPILPGAFQILVVGK